ncbi:hypothetical protein BR93DRAFT_94631 [Coniochaeta sp. PMI_546]|nr:hypothetical protein BR93DRAFT_94631 [Coniochaeta sp. PMI_546]
MASDIELELINSVKSLFDSPAYSDLKIASLSREYEVHRAIVCPRSMFLSQKCEEAGKQPSGVVFLNLGDDDPQVVDMVMQYLYRLDYQSLTIDTVSPMPVISRFSGSKQTEGIPLDHVPAASSHGTPMLPGEMSNNGQKDPQSYDGVLAKMPEIATEVYPSQPCSREILAPPQLDPEPEAMPVPEHVLEPEPAPDMDWFDESWGPPKKTKKGKKKEKTKRSVWYTGPELAEETPPEELVHGLIEPPLKIQESMLLHARVYVQAIKYGIKGLQDLALGKLSAQAEEDWDTKEFLRTADEVYDYYGSISGIQLVKDVVIQTFSGHLELLDKEDTVTTLRGRDIATDLLLHLHRTRNLF